MPHKPKNDFPLPDYLDGLIDKLRQQIPVAVQQHDAGAVHQARVATRRLTAALHVLKPILSKPRRHEFAGTLRRLRRRLGSLRDLDVMIDQLTAVHAPRSQLAIEWARRHLDLQRDEQRIKTEKKIAPAKLLTKLTGWGDVRQDIIDGRQAIDSLLAESLHLQLDAFIEHSDAATSHDPHELRIAGKSLRYSLEMAVESGHRLPPAITRSFKKMQDALGEWHDFVVLAERLMSLSLDEELGLHDIPMQTAVLNLARMFLARAGRSLARFSAAWQKSGSETARIIRQTFPLTQPVDDDAFNAPKTDHDPTGSAESPADPMPSEVPPNETSAA
jgi:CHAD domain-containing protein